MQMDDALNSLITIINEHQSMALSTLLEFWKLIMYIYISVSKHVNIFRGVQCFNVIFVFTLRASPAPIGLISAWWGDTFYYCLLIIIFSNIAHRYLLYDCMSNMLTFNCTLFMKVFENIYGHDKLLLFNWDVVRVLTAPSTWQAQEVNFINTI